MGSAYNTRQHSFVLCIYKFFVELLTIILKKSIYILMLLMITLRFLKEKWIVEGSWLLRDEIHISTWVWLNISALAGHWLGTAVRIWLNHFSPHLKYCILNSSARMKCSKCTGFEGNDQEGFLEAVPLEFYYSLYY